MARNASVIMTKEETKAALTTLKGDLKIAKAAQKAVGTEQKIAEKTFNAQMKEFAKAAKLADKAVADIEAKIAKLTPA